MVEFFKNFISPMFKEIIINFAQSFTLQAFSPECAMSTAIVIFRFNILNIIVL